MSCQHPLSKTKRLGFGLVLLFVMVAVVEGISFGVYRLMNGKVFRPAEMVETIRREIAPPAEAITGKNEIIWGDFVEVVHPYFGYVGDPRRNRATWGVSELGFVHSEGVTTLPKRSADKFVVAVFGGSFANGVYLELERLVAEHAKSLGRTPVVLNFASGGYKQPQQLNILSYLLASGAEFDVAINLDGLNDIALPIGENIPRSVHPFFPRAWDGRTAQSIDPETIRRIGNVEGLRERRAAWAGRFLDAHLNWSPTFSLIWLSVDKLMAERLHIARERVAESRKAVSDYISTGPRYEFSTKEQLYRDVVRFWANASRQMDALCRDAGITYFHVLQPNQYVEGAKPMSAAEVRRAITPNHPYAEAVRVGYPMLSQAGAELARSGLRFIDLTRIYAAVEEPLYVDDCCHTNAEGYRRVAQRILNEVVRSSSARN